MSTQFFQCPRCRAVNPVRVRFCSNCALPFQQQNPVALMPVPKKNTSSLLLPLGIIFGVVGFCALFGIIASLNEKKSTNDIALRSNTSNTNTLSDASPIENSNTTANQKAATPTEQLFKPDLICSIPKQVAPNTPFASLDGGTWGKWSDSGGDLDYGCNGGKDSFKLVDSDNGDITAEFGAIGNAETVHYVTAEYMAMQYTGLTLDEKKLRQKYVDFCDLLSLRFYGAKLPEKFRKRMLDESTYSASGTANEFAVKVGDGYVNLSSNKAKNVMVLLDVHFFSSEAEYKKYKDS